MQWRKSGAQASFWLNVDLLSRKTFCTRSHFRLSDVYAVSHA